VWSYNSTLPYVSMVSQLNKQNADRVSCLVYMHYCVKLVVRTHMNACTCTYTYMGMHFLHTTCHVTNMM